MFEKLSEWVARQPKIEAKDGIGNDIPDEDKPSYLMPAHIERIRAKLATDLTTAVTFVPDRFLGGDGSQVSLGIRYGVAEFRRTGFFLLDSGGGISVGVAFRQMSSGDQKMDSANRVYTGVDAPGRWVMLNGEVRWSPEPLPPPNTVPERRPTSGADLVSTIPTQESGRGFTDADRALLNRIASRMGI